MLTSVRLSSESGMCLSRVLPLSFYFNQCGNYSSISAKRLSRTRETKRLPIA